MDTKGIIKPIDNVSKKLSISNSNTTYELSKFPKFLYIDSSDKIL